MREVLPRRAHSKVAVPIVVVPVVDVEPVAIEVAHVDVIAIAVHGYYLFPSASPEIEVYGLTTYILFLLNLIREQPYGISTRNKQEVPLICELFAIVIPKPSQSNCYEDVLQIFSQKLCTSDEAMSVHR